MLSLGHVSPSVISISELRTLLIEIVGKLDRQYKIPFEPETDMWTFYKTLTCTTLIDQDQLIVVLTIQLLDNRGKFEIFKIHNLPIPYNGTDQTIQAKFQLESSHIAINKRRTQFALLSDLEARDCSNYLRPYCTFRSPVYSSMSAKMCMLHLFMGQ